ncbi:MAG: hypothetical protein RR014_00445, partial [Bilophila sp.]
MSCCKNIVLGSFLLAALAVVLALLSTGNTLILVLSLVLAAGAILLGILAQRGLATPLATLKSHLDALNQPLRTPSTTTNTGTLNMTSTDHHLNTLEGEIGELYRAITLLNKNRTQALTENRTCKESMSLQTEELQSALTQAHTQRENMEHMLSGMNTVAGKAKDISGRIHAALRTLSQQVAEVDNGVETQRYKLQETSSSIAAMLHSATDMARTSVTASEGASVSRNQAQTSAGNVEQSVSAIQKVKKSTLALKETMGELAVQ